jgi:glycosyltransferase involved in cell wall biosynthesis
MNAMNESCKDISYVIVTAARNEGKYIERTIQSVISQTKLPRKWIIVSDGSTDRTDAIVSQYLPNAPWIALLRKPGDAMRNFASKAFCFNEGVKALGEIDYDVIVNLDADVSFDKNYFGYLMEKFAQDPALGVAGTAFRDKSIQYNYDFVGLDHVVGICQLFRRECFQQIGGYQPIKGGGVDLVAVLTARMNGWKTRTFAEINCDHNRSMGTSLSGPIRLRYRYGAEDYYLGSHPIWELLRSLRHIQDRPYVIGGMAILAGYLHAWIVRHPKPVSDQFVSFRRKEQMDRLKRILQNFRGSKTRHSRAAQA